MQGFFGLRLGGGVGTLCSLRLQRDRGGGAGNGERPFPAGAYQRKHLKNIYDLLNVQRGKSVQNLMGDVQTQSSLSPKRD